MQTYVVELHYGKDRLCSCIAKAAKELNGVIKYMETKSRLGLDYEPRMERFDFMQEPIIPGDFNLKIRYTFKAVSRK